MCIEIKIKKWLFWDGRTHSQECVYRNSITEWHDNSIDWTHSQECVYRNISGVYRFNKNETDLEECVYRNRVMPV